MTDVKSRVGTPARLLLAPKPGVRRFPQRRAPGVDQRQERCPGDREPSPAIGITDPGLARRRRVAVDLAAAPAVGGPAAPSPAPASQRCGPVVASGQRPTVTPPTSSLPSSPAPAGRAQAAYGPCPQHRPSALVTSPPSTDSVRSTAAARPSADGRSCAARKRWRRRRYGRVGDGPAGHRANVDLVGLGCLVQFSCGLRRRLRRSRRRTPGRWRDPSPGRAKWARWSRCDRPERQGVRPGRRAVGDRVPDGTNHPIRARVGRTRRFSVAAGQGAELRGAGGAPGCGLPGRRVTRCRVLAALRGALGELRPSLRVLASHAVTPRSRAG